MTCERCGADPIISSTCSIFNTEQICLVCQRREEAHPDYESARAAEAAAVRSGNYNFPGVGKPADL